MRTFLAVALLSVTGISHAAIINEYTSLGNYNAATGPQTIVSFTDLANGTLLSNQYSSLGVTFVDGNDRVETNASFITDGLGVNGYGSIELLFDGVLNSIGAEFPGAAQFELYLGSTLVDTSSQFAGSGTGFFGGVTSTSFNRVIISDWVDDLVFIDNLHFGQVVPIPAAAWLFLSGLGLLGWVKRRTLKQT